MTEEHLHNCDVRILLYMESELYYIIAVEYMYRKKKRSQ